MSTVVSPCGLHLFRPPYQRCEPLPLHWSPDLLLPGAAVVWFMAPTEQVVAELEWLWERPRTLPLFLVLPEPEDVPPLASLLRGVSDLAPRAVLPSGATGTAAALRVLLAAPPQSLARAVIALLLRMGLLSEQDDPARVGAIFDRASHVSSVEHLSQTMFQSRRTLGRFFRSRDLPVPSHWLQFARLLHVSIQLQNTTTNIGRVAGRFGFPDGFTMSNSMKRLIGYRPSFVREHLGWEWIVAAWLRRERLVGERDPEADPS
jgi:AraC-like DNA-binding protein